MADYQREQEFSGLGMKAAAYGSGLVDSLALGAGDALLATGADALGQGQQFRQFIQDADRFAPGSRMAGQVTGFVAPMLFTGGGSSAASGLGRAGRVATALPRGLSAVAEGAGSLASRAVGGGLPGRFVAPVVSGALELGVYGSGQEVSRTVIRDPRADGEALVAAMGRGFARGAAEGAAFGGALGVGSVALGAAGRGVARLGESARTRIGEFVDTTTAKVRGLEDTLRAGGLPSTVEGLAGRGLDEATALAERVTGRAAAGEATTLAGKADRLARTAIDVDKAAVEKAFQSLGSTSKTLAEAEKLGELKALAAKQIVEDLPRLLKKDGKVLTFVEQAEAAPLLKREIGGRMEALLKKVDSTGERLSAGTWVDKVRKEVVADLKTVAGAEGQAKKLEKYLDSLKEKGADLSFEKFHKQRQLLDSKVQKFERSGDKFTADAWRKTRQILESEFTQAADKAVSKIGGSFAEEWRAVKGEYRTASWIDKAAKEGAKRANGNRALGFSEQVGALTGAVLGGGGPVGLATSVASAVANRAIKQVGDQTTAAILREMQRGRPLVEAIADVSRRNLGERAQRFLELAAPVRDRAARTLGRARERAGAVVSEVAEVGRTVARNTVQGVQAVGRGAKRTSEAAILAADFETRRREVLAAKAAGSERVPQLARRYQQAGASPETAQAAAETQARGELLLAKKMPPIPQRMKTLQPELSTDFPDPQAMETWLRLAKIVDAPEAALDLMDTGAFDAEEAAVYREAWPSHYQQLRDALAFEIQAKTDRGEVIPYEKALVLGTLFDVVADPTLDPIFIAAMQAQPAPTTPPLAPSRRAVSKAPVLFDPGKAL